MHHRTGSRRWLAVVLVASIGISGSALLLRSSYLAAASRLDLVQTSVADLHRLSALEWEAIASGQVEAETRVTVDRLRVNLQATSAALVERGVLPDEALDEFEVLSAAVAQELELLAAGLVDAAVELDEEVVDPTFDRLINIYDGAAVRARSDAERTNQVTGLLLVIVSLAGVVFSGAGVRKSEAIQHLKQVMRSKDDLIATIAHELRTPLTSVIGFAELLLDQAPKLSPQELRDTIRIIADEGTDLSNIIDDLLVAAKTEAGTLQLVEVRVDLRAQTAQVLERWEPEVVSNVRFSGRPVHTTGDPARVRQILRNLISNALRYGGEEVRVDVSSESGSAVVRVCDNGPGVPIEEQEAIFQPYRRSHAAPGLTASMGLGLTISRQLAQRMGGDVTYRREPGESIFELALPITLAEPSSLDSEQADQMESRRPQKHLLRPHPEDARLSTSHTVPGHS